MTGPECQFSFENGKLAWLIGLVFASVLLVQHFEIPYGKFSAGRASSSLTRRNSVHGVANFSLTEEQNSEYSVNNSVLGNSGIEKDNVGISIGELLFQESYHNLTVNTLKRHNSLEAEKAREFEYSTRAQQPDKDASSTCGNIQKKNTTSSTEEMRKGNPNIAYGYIQFQLPQKRPPYRDAYPRNMERNKKAPVRSFVSNTTTVDKDVLFGRQHSHIGLLGRNSSMTNTPEMKETSERTEGKVVSIRELNDLLFQSRTSSLPNSMTLRPSAGDDQIMKARSQIEGAAIFKDNSGLYAPIYWNISKFKRSYELMEQVLKVYIYREGKRPVFHQPRLAGIYASEGWFMKLLQENKQYVTTNPREAHLFYLPFSSQRLEEALYVPNSHSFDNLKQYLGNYIDMIKARYSFWNRTSGADHFLVACHDWAPEETKRLMANCIRALCNADMKEGFQLGKDVSLPETYVHSSQFSPRDLGGRPPSQRHILAFFAGRMHGYVRPLLLKYWEHKDPDMKIVGRLRDASYIRHMKSSKYCICAKGYEVNSPRLVEAIIYGCIPVILSDNYVPPFIEVLNWEKFAIFVLEKDIPNLKNILLSISERRYLVMQQRVKKVRQHFLWQSSPMKYDIFHMILHSIWYNRVFQTMQL
ncbi:hypothetical protein ACH5RR_041208 [Cinchona calisaya]|uniref:Exostosin GT47 domain-containing protein n=1 Tax=Cinchona calisaya TaxID=153742 RepID=A0ABD2XVI5_9GENT